MIYIVFKGQYSHDEIAQGVIDILNLLKGPYGVDHFGHVSFEMSLKDQTNQEVELMNVLTGEPIQIIEFYKSSKQPKRYGHLTLVVDNTKPPSS